MKTLKSMIYAAVALLGMSVGTANAAPVVPDIFNLEQMPEIADGIHLADYYYGDDAWGTVPLFKLTNFHKETLPADYNYYGSINLYMPTGVVTWAYCEVDDAGVVKCNAEYLNNALTWFSENPALRDINVALYLTAYNGPTYVRLNTGNGIASEIQVIKMAPLPPSYLVEEAYYAIVNGQEIAMSPANPDDIYNPPLFRADLEVPASGASVTIKSKSGLVYGAGSNGSLEIDGPPIVIGPGKRSLTINLKEMTYTVGVSLDRIYAYSSSPANSFALTTTDYVNYFGFAGLRVASFRLVDDPSSPSTYWGYSNGDATSGHLAEFGGAPTPVQVSQKGCYFLHINFLDLSYTAKRIDTFGVMGSFNGWTEDVPMTATNNYSSVWTADVTFSEGDTFKIRSNGDWNDPNLGGTMDDLVEHGPDIQWPYGAGTFTLTLDLTSVPYKITAVKK